MLSHTNEPCTSRCVASLITTVLGCAAAWMRAARLGTLPTTSGWRLAPKPISLASTTPLSMPTRTSSRASGGRRGRLAKAAHDLHRRADGGARVLAVRRRIAEVGEHAVAQVLRDEAARARDLAVADALERAHQVAPLLQLQPLRALGRVDQVAEHHGDVALLADAGRPIGRLAVSGRVRRGRRRAAGRRSGRRTEPPPGWFPRSGDRP